MSIDLFRAAKIHILQLAIEKLVNNQARFICDAIDSAADSLVFVPHATECKYQLINYIQHALVDTVCLEAWILMRAYGKPIALSLDQDEAHATRIRWTQAMLRAVKNDTEVKPDWRGKIGYDCL
jgi:hypothetical protein